MESDESSVETPRRPSWPRRVDEELSVRFPFVWRTRLHVSVPVGLGMISVAVTYGNSLVTPLTMLGLDEAVSAVAATAVAAYAVLVALVVDAVRRAGSIRSVADHVRLFVCTGVPAVAIAMTPTAFVESMARHVAQFETEAAMAIHVRNGYWRCWKDENALAYHVALHRDALEKAAARYVGGEAELSIQRDYYCGSAQSIDMTPFFQVLANPPGYDVYPLRMRLMHVEAAQRARQGDYTLYLGWSPRFALLLGLLTGACSVLIASTYVPAPRRFTERIRSLRSPAMLVGIDRRLASTRPVIWSADVLRTGSLLVAVGGLFVFIWMDLAHGSSDYWLTAFAVAFLLAAYTQTLARARLLSWQGELGVYLLHALAVVIGGLAVEAAYPETQYGSEGILALGLAVAAALHGARLTAFTDFLGSLVTGLGLGIALVFAAEAARGGAPVESLWLAGPLSAVALLAVAARRFNTPPRLRRTVYAVVLVAAWAPAFGIAEYARMSDMVVADRPTLQAGTVVIVAAILYFLRNERRVLSCSD